MIRWLLTDLDVTASEVVEALVAGLALTAILVAFLAVANVSIIAALVALVVFNAGFLAGAWWAGGRR